MITYGHYKELINELKGDRVLKRMEMEFKKRRAMFCCLLFILIYYFFTKNEMSKGETLESV